MSLAANSLDPHLSWNLVQDVRQMLIYPFMVNAFRAGAIAAVLAGVVGWFMVLRRQTFAGHTLAIVGFPGAAGAVLVGVSAAYGLFLFTAVAAILIGLVPGSGGRRYSEESAVIGTVQAFALACGLFFVSLYGGFLGGANAMLFGSFLGITGQQVVVLLAIAVLTLTILAAVARPLLFASIDPDVAAARGVPVRALSSGFLVVLALAAAEATQITGALLVFCLLVVPAATAQAFTANPRVSMMLTVVLGVCVTWVSIFVAYYFPYPIGFFLTSAAFALYLVARGWRQRTATVSAGTAGEPR
jgi:zinc/manganese transport system permease protein